MAIDTQRSLAEEQRHKAMGHPIRRAALRHLLEHGPASPKQICDALGAFDSGLVSYHCKRLVDLDHAELVRTEKVRGAVRHVYRATRRHMIESKEWNAVDPVDRPGLLVDFAQPFVDDFNASMQAGMLGSDENWHISRNPLHGVDAEGLAEIRKIQDRALEETSEVLARVSERRRPGQTGAEVNVSVFMAAFQVPHF